MMAITHAHSILGWQENMVSEEMPPKWMWHLDWELEVWFERVDKERKARFGGGGDDEDTGDMMTNDLAKGRR